jgi:hypothetical protein
MVWDALNDWHAIQAHSASLDTDQTYQAPVLSAGGYESIREALDTARRPLQDWTTSSNRRRRISRLIGARRLSIV